MGTYAFVASSTGIRTFAAATVTVTAARIATAALATPLKQGVWLQATSTNTDTIYVGDSTVTTANGLALAAGQREFFHCDDPNDIFAVAGSGSQNLRVAGT